MDRDVDCILKLEVPVIVRLGERRLKLREVLQLAPGAIIELPKSADEMLDLMVNNRPIGGGAAVKIGENFGIRIDWVGNAEDRISALATEAPDETDEDAIAMSLLAGQL